MDFATVRARLEAKGFNLADLEFVGHSEIVVAGPQRLLPKEQGERNHPGRFSETHRLPARQPAVPELQRKALEKAVSAAVTKGIHRRYPDAGRVFVTAEIRPTQVQFLLAAVLSSAKR